MAGEPILIVDHTPVNLNLMRLLLTHEGYAVRTAARAEEAIEMLGSYRPELILADMQLPGMDGLELTRRIKKNPQTHTIKVVAVTGLALSEDQNRAVGAGCDGFLTRPIETHVLATRIREVLDRSEIVSHCPLPVSETPFENTVAGPELDGLRRAFVNEGAAKTLQMLHRLETGFDAELASRQLHGWIGSSGLLGHPQIAKMAREMEEMLRQPPFQPAEMQRCLTALLKAFEELRDAGCAPVPEDVAKALFGKRVAMIGFTPECAGSVCGALAQVKAEPQLFEADDADWQSVEACDLVMLHVRPEIENCRWLEAVPAGKQLVLAGERRDLLKLPATVLAGDAELVADPWHAEEILMRLHLALNRRASAPAREPVAAPVPVVAPLPAPARPEAGQPATVILRPKVVLADDDAIVLTVVGSTLQNYGMTCEPANNGRDALRLIRQTQPHVAVLDVNMPGLDGYEVLAAVRAENLPVAVILLTARQREGDILRGFQLGADDYLVKPFNPLELMARMKRLLRR